MFFSPLPKLCRHGQKKPSSWCQGRSCPETAGSPAAPWEVAVQSISLAAPPCCTTPWGTSETRCRRETRNKRSERGKIIQIISISTRSSPFHPFERWHTLREMAEGVKHLSEFPFNLNGSIHWKWNSPVQRWYCRCDIFIKKKRTEAARVVHSCNSVSGAFKAQAKQKY